MMILLYNIYFAAIWLYRMGDVVLRQHFKLVKSWCKRFKCVRTLLKRFKIDDYDKSLRDSQRLKVIHEWKRYLTPTSEKNKKRES